VKPCTVEQLAARCGSLVVPEDRLTGKGRTITVQFVVVPATGPHPAPDPVVYFAGGPGGSAVAEIPTDLPDLLALNVRFALPGQGHDVNSASWQACAGLIDQAFIEHASLAHLNTSCLSTITAFFFLTLH
jgi:hypothetical protein